MIVYAEIECIIYGTQSLKEKRSFIKRLISIIRKDYNVAISEIDYQDLWQRTKFGVVTVSNNYTYCEKVMQQVLKTIDQFSEMERTVTSIDRL